MSRFFMRRPVVAIVISILMVIAGAITMLAATAIAIFIIPALYVIVEHVAGMQRAHLAGPSPNRVQCRAIKP